MITRRSLRLRQLNSQIKSAAVASSSSSSPLLVETSEPIERTAKKRARIDLSNLEMKMKLNTINLESLPNEILEEIFMLIDDVAFLNLADTCTRFEAIALNVASKRYSNRYCVISAQSEGDSEMYTTLFNHFGSSIGAIQVNHIKDNAANHWVINIIRSHISHITKLIISNCTFTRNAILSLPMDNITHLVLDDVSFGRLKFDLFNCRKLVKLDLRKSYFLDHETIKRIICNNPALQSLLCDPLHIGHLNQIKELGVVCLYSSNAEQDFEQSNLPRIIDPECIEFLQRLSFGCKQIKHLELRFDEDLEWNSELIEAIGSFQQVESLTLIQDGNDLKIHDIESALNHLPNLRQLRIEIEHLNSDFSTLLHACPSLERITAALDNAYDFFNAYIFEAFIYNVAITGKSNARIEFENYGEIVGSITENGMVWRNKLMFWTSCEKNDTNIHLLSLSNQMETTDGGGKCTEKQGRDRDAVQRNLLDQIFDYLDMHSLHFFAQTSPRSKQLVENYIKMHSKQNGIFTITNEFHPFEHYGRYDKMHKMFTPHVTNLKVYKLRRLNLKESIILSGYKQLTKISFYDENTITKWNLPKTVRHLVFDGAFVMDSFEFRPDFSRWNKNIEILEFKNAGKFNAVASIRKNALKFGNLKKFIFNYRGDAQIENLKKIFEGKDTQLVPIFPNSTANY